VFNGTIKGIYFDLDKDTIKPRSRPVLDRAVRSSSTSPSVRVEISGHTDSTGSLAYNRDLSRRRAESVKRYLVEHGIDPARIQTRGAGPDEPVDSNRSAAGRAKQSPHRVRPASSAKNPDRQPTRSRLTPPAT
jgi:outer membrane protein OmpA-like peptidoglycan-associated protein